MTRALLFSVILASLVAVASVHAQPAEPLSSHGYAPAPPPIEALQPPMPKTQRLGTVRPVDLLPSSPERLASARPSRLASLDRSFARAMESYVAETPLRRARPFLLGGEDNGRRAPFPSESAQESDTGLRLYLLIGAAVLVAGWVSYAVFASGQDDGTPPDPPPRPQPQQ